MATFSGFSMAVMLFVACGAVLTAQRVASHDDGVTPFSSNFDIATSPVGDELPALPPNEQLPPEPAQGYYKFLASCTTALTEKCGKEIFSALSEKCGKEIFSALSGKKPVDGPCCYRLVKKTGRHCHDELSKELTRIPAYMPYKRFIIQRSDFIWNYCVKQVGDVPSSPSF